MARRPGALVGRILASCALLLFAGLAVASGLDRMSLQSPALGRLIPPVLRAQSARSGAALAIARQQPGEALARAREAVTADPLHPASTSLLGAAYFLNNDLPRAEAAFRVAARFGWRQPETQLYWYQAALQSGDMPRAADRADALLRTHPGLPQAEAVLAPLETSPAGRAALAQRMADRPGWLLPYLRPDATVDDAALERRAVMLAELARAGTRLGCTETGPFVTHALERGARKAAETVWVAHCPGAKLTDTLADGGFERFGQQEASPFGWIAVRSGDVMVRPVIESAGDAALQLRNRGSVSRLALRQPLALEPGLYRVTAKVAPGAVVASFGCNGVPGREARQEGDVGAGGQLLRVERCARLELGLWLRPGGRDVTLDDVVIEKAG